MEEIQHVAIDVEIPAGFLEEKKIGILRVEGVDVAADEQQNFIKKLDEVPGEPLKPQPDNWSNCTVKMETEHIAIDMDVLGEISTEKNIEKKITREGKEGEDLQSLMKKRLKEVPKDPLAERTIFRVPDKFHEVQKGLFEPQLVSIGPYHHGKDSLRFMEEEKWSFLRDFLAAGQNVGIEVYIQEIKALEERARRCYSENIKMKSDDFVMMLLLDGCFLLEHVIRFSREQCIAICNVGWVGLSLGTDMFLLENQIPFFVIHKLFAIQGGRAHNCEGSPLNCPLLQILFNSHYFLGDIAHSATWKPPEVSCHNIYHFLHLRYISRVGDNMVYEESTSRAASELQTLWMDVALISKVKEVANPRGIPCARMLHEAGVKFRRKKSPRDYYDISFNNGKIEIPFCILNYKVKIMCANYATFEQTQLSFISKMPVTSHLALMDALVNTEEDVAILERNGILENNLRSEEDAADFFNDLGELLIAQKYVGSSLFDEIREYGNKTRHKQRARLMHDYCSSPWSAISVGAAGILLVLTFLQTYYSAAK